MLRHLAKFGFGSDDLVQVYKSNIRPVIEYCSPVYHSLLTGEQAQKLERLQYQSLKCIYGLGKSYEDLLEESGLSRLSDRREEATLKFARKAEAGAFGRWFPKRNASRQLRNEAVYHEEYARCDRLRNSPIYTMRRMLNDNV